MTQGLHDRAEGIVGRFDRTLDEARAHLEDGDASSNAVRTLVLEVRTLQFAADHLERTGDVTPALREGVDRVETSYGEFVDRVGDPFLDALHRELRDLADRYPRAVCSVFDREHVGMETFNDFDTRDAIEMLADELAGKRDIERLRVRVEGVDQVFRCKYRRNEAVVRRHEDEIARPSFPEQYWWRHPDAVFED